MSTNLDSLDEIFSQPTRNARAGGKFAPKLKPRPKNETSKMLPSSQPVQNINSVGADTKKPSENNLNSGVESFNDSSLASSSSEHLIGENLVDNNGPQTDVVLPEVHRKPIGEEALLNTEVDPLDDNEIEKASENNSDNNLEPGQGNADAGVEKSFDDVSFQNTTTAGSATSTDNDPWDEFFSPATRNEDPPAPDAPSVQTRLEDHIIIDDFPRDEEAVTDCDIGFHFNDGLLEIEEIETGPCMEGSETIFEMTTQSGQRSRKIQPTPRSQADTREIGAASHPDGSGFVSCFDNDDFMSEIFSNEDLNNPAESSFGDAFCTEDGPSGFQESFDKSAEIRENTTTMACDDSLEHQETSVDGQDNEAGVTIRKRRKRKNKYALDENEDEAHDVGNLGNENIEEHDRSEDGNEVERESQTEKKTKRSKKPSSHKEKRVRKRKNINEAPDQKTHKPPKKFSHSTRSNKRRVDKVLLETPEEDINVRKLRMRDMLLLAEHREKAASKGGKTIEPPPADKSNSHDDHLEGEDLDKTQNTDYFNYHSYMKKTPRSRWSNQDTELFYEGVRQFGSDISMIQQLFPDRTRAQVKLKYKKEERQQPLRLHDALTNRSGDHSHFQRVIEQLKQLAAQENQNSFENDSFDLTGNEEDATTEINEDVDNLEKAEEREEEEREPDPSGAQSPPKSFYDSEDELSAYCQYKNPI